MRKLRQGDCSSFGAGFLMIAALALAVAALASKPAQAQGYECGAHPIILDRLFDVYGETRQAVSLTPEGRMVEVFANSQSGTWSITVTDPNGLTCLVLHGASFELTPNDTPLIDPIGWERTR